MQGLMKKRCRNDSIFQKSYLKRYYTLDFGNAVMFIKDGDTIPFRDIVRVMLPQFNQEEVFRKNVNSKTFTFPFFVKTNMRFMELYAASEEERQMWVAGFEYVLISTKVI